LNLTHFLTCVFVLAMSSKRKNSGRDESKQKTEPAKAEQDDDFSHAKFQALGEISREPKRRGNKPYNTEWKSSNDDTLLENYLVLGQNNNRVFQDAIFGAVMNICKNRALQILSDATRDERKGLTIGDIDEWVGGFVNGVMEVVEVENCFSDFDEWVKDEFLRGEVGRKRSRARKTM
jgi:hypothetical protein